MEAIIFYHQLGKAGKLGVPGPDRNASGVRQVFYDKTENQWVAKWNENGMNRFMLFSVKSMGFNAAYEAAVALRTQKLRDMHKFLPMRTRYKVKKKPYGTLRS